MKQVNGSGHADDCVFTSDYLIPPSKVDIFKDDVQIHPGTQSSGSVIPAPNTQTSSDKTVCMKHWTAAHMVSEGTVEVFLQTGSFLSVCHHAIIETFMEMRNSGEL